MTANLSICLQLARFHGMEDSKPLAVIRGSVWKEARERLYRLMTGFPYGCCVGMKPSREGAAR